MPRELSKDLFELTSVKAQQTAELPTLKNTYSPVIENEKVQTHLELLKRKIKEQDAKIEMLASKVHELIEGAKLRFERSASFQNRTDEYLKSMQQDSAAKYAQLAGRLNERRVADTKIQEMIERHTQLVQNYELRLTHLQKVIAEQEMQLVAARSELRETQKELLRLRR